MFIHDADHTTRDWIILWDMDMQNLMAANLQCDVISHLSFPQITSEILICTCDM